MSTTQLLLGGFSGIIVGFILGLVGGGGSILAVPLLLYFVGVQDPHLAIGTASMAVAANALTGLSNHARKGNVKWHCGAVFATAGVIGAAVGSFFGKSINGQLLLVLFAGLMLVVAALMLRSRNQEGDPAVMLARSNAPALMGAGAATGLLSGFFGIGGGFLVVPGLMAATGMPILFAVGTSLVAVSAFGLTTAVSYASSGLLSWPLAIAFAIGGFAGSWIGTHSAGKLAQRRGALNVTLAALIVLVAIYMLYRSASALGWI